MVHLQCTLQLIGSSLRMSSFVGNDGKNRRLSEEGIQSLEKKLELVTDELHNRLIVIEARWRRNLMDWGF